jgi:modification methylase
MSKTTSFGTSKREGHDSSTFYARNIYNGHSNTNGDSKDGTDLEALGGSLEWANQIYLGSSESMDHIPSNSVGLAFTSPPYNVGKDYDDDMSLDDYLDEGCA